MRSLLPALVVLASVVFASARLAQPRPRPGVEAGFPTDVAVVAFPTALSTPGLTTRKWSGIVKSTGRNYTAYTALVADPRYVSVEVPADRCGERAFTSATAQARNCLYATNGGFFSFSGPNYCLGNLIVNGTAIETPATPNVNFGLLSNGSYFIGFVNSTTLPHYKFQSLVQGTGWLVRNGVSYLTKSQDIDPSSGFVTEKAPRTAVGWYANGTAVIFQVDGVEVTDVGLDLFETTEVLLDLGLDHAANLDGGGSSVSVFGGKVISVPTCNDTLPPICERDVTSVTCVRTTPNKDFAIAL